MSSIANMSVMLSLDSAKFNSGLQSAITSAKAFVGAVTAGLAVNSFVGTIRALENVGDSAAAAGVSIREFMAATGEMNAEDTAATTQALNKMGKALAEISAGGDEKQKSLRGLGLDPQAMQSDGTFNALRKVAQAYTEAQDPVKKLAIAYEVFGKAATEVIPVLEKLSGLSGEIGGKFAGMGPAAIALAETQEKLITKLENALKGGKNQFVLGAAGVFQDIAHIMSGEQGESPLARDKRIMQEAFDQEIKDAKGLKAAREAARREAEAKPFKESIEKMDKQDTEELNKNRLHDIHQDVRGRFKEGLEAFQAQAKRMGGEFDGDAQLNAIRDRMDGYLKESEELKRLDEIKNRFLDPPKRATWLEIFKDTRSPLQVFAAEMNKMAVMSFAGAPRKLVDKSMAQSFLDLEKGIPNTFGMTARNMQRGSAEEGSFLANFEQQRFGESRNASERVAAILEITKGIEERQAVLLSEIAAALRARGGIGMVKGM